MFPISRILVPVDFSDRCLGMMPYVRVIAERYEAEVILLHVSNPVYAIPETGISAPALVPVPKWVFTERTKQLEEFATAELQGLSVRRLVYEGDPESQIAAFPEAEDVQLVIMPTRGYGILRRYLIGSVTAKVLHDVACPVLTGVHMEAQAPLANVNLSTIVCALDLNPRSREALNWASRLAEDFNANLSLVHVIPSLSTGPYVTFSSALKAEAEQSVRNELQALQREVGVANVTTAVQEGDIATGVWSFSRSVGADLVIIGRAAQEAGTGRLRTNAYAIIRQAPCPVLSV